MDTTQPQRGPFSVLSFSLLILFYKKEEVRPETERTAVLHRRGWPGQGMVGGVQNSFPLCPPHTLHLQKEGYGWMALAISRGVTCLSCAEVWGEIWREGNDPTSEECNIFVAWWWWGLGKPCLALPFLPPRQRVMFVVSISALTVAQNPSALISGL